MAKMRIKIIGTLTVGTLFYSLMAVPVFPEEVFGPPAPSDTTTSTPVVPTNGTSGNKALTFDGVLGKINSGLDTVDDFLSSGGSLVDGALGKATGFISGLLGDTGNQIANFFKDVFQVVNLINRVANSVGKIGTFWNDFYGSVLGVVGQAKDCVSSPVSVGFGSSSLVNIDYNPSTWCFGLLQPRLPANPGGDGSAIVDGGDGTTDPGTDGEGREEDGTLTFTAPQPTAYPGQIFGMPSATGGADATSVARTIPEAMVKAAQGTALGIPDLTKLRQQANDIDFGQDAFETIPVIGKYHSVEAVENVTLRNVGLQPLSTAGQKQVEELAQASQQIIVQTAQDAAASQKENVTQDVMKSMTRIQASQTPILASIATEISTSKQQTGASNVVLSNISRQLSEQQKLERSRKGALAYSVLFKALNSNLR